jgi:hypothetical protein
MRSSSLAPRALVTTSILLFSSAPLARDRPGIPRTLSVKQESAGELTLTLRNNAREGAGHFRVRNVDGGVRVDPEIERRVSEESEGYSAKTQCTPLSA